MRNALWLILSITALLSVPQEKTVTRAELTNYEQTSRYDDVIRFCEELGRLSPSVRVDNFGKTEEGRNLPLLVLSDPPVTSRSDAARAGKPVIFIMANIHAGEVEGKEASLDIARRIAVGDLKPVLKNLVVLIAPIYNADGNERISPTNRTAQNGPVAGVGTRENAKGLDLNRDFIKLESAEARSLVRLLNTWDPHLTVDLHTTNGSYHGYHLTYAPSLNPNTSPQLINFSREIMLPRIGRAVEQKHKFRTYYYGNFATREALTRELNSFPATVPDANTDRTVETRVWRTFDHRPRFGNNYVGLRNRLTILSEAYSYLEFSRRVAVTAAFVEEILRFSSDNKAAILKLTAAVDAQAHAGKSGPQGVEFSLSTSPKPVNILVGEVTRVRNPRSDREMTVMIEDKFKPVSMIEYGTFAATRTSTMPSAYIFRDTKVRQLLLEHGVVVDVLDKPTRIEVDAFHISEVNRAARAFQGHQEVRLKGLWKREAITFEAGAFVVRTAQRLAPLAFYLLDAESDDGLVTWNFLDEHLGQGRVFPIYRKRD